MNGMTLTIKGLFGHFNYEIPLYGLDNSDGIPMSSGVTILTGPNGYGKTTVLRMLEAISKGDLAFFCNLKFETFILGRDTDDKNFKIQRTNEGLVINGRKLLFEQIELYSTLFNQALEEAVDEATKSVFADVPNGSVITKEFVLSNVRKSAQDIAKQKVERLAQRNPDFIEVLRQLATFFYKAFIIPEQRLLEIRDIPLTYEGKRLESSGKPIMTQKVNEAVSGLPAKLTEHFSAALDNYANITNKLNASFPSRVLSQSADSNLTKEEFDRLYRDMNDKLRVLQENGLSEFEQQEIPEFRVEKTGGLRVFFDDFNEKYKVYEPLINKLTLFRKVLNRRFKDFKRVEISREYGLRVRDIQTDENGDIIPLEKLSSGEQETLVLYYQLIFETEPGTMLLIDEPEISLHIEWQMTFIDELKEIVRLNNLQAVVATHSESILDANWDIQVDLGALYQDERGKLHQ